MNVLRRKLMAAILSHPDSSAIELSLLVDRTPADIRYHLSYLCDEGMISRRISKQIASRGRPVFIYSATHKVVADNIPQLCSVTLTILQTLPDGLMKIADQITREPLNAKASRDRLLQVITNLNGMGYSSAWEARQAGPSIIFHHCPYLELLSDHPELCSLDELIISNWLGKKPKRRTSIRDGAHLCVFDI